LVLTGLPQSPFLSGVPGVVQYFEVGDNQVAATSQVQSFYSIWDDGIAASAAPYDRSNLLENKLLRRLILMVPCLF